MTDTLAKLFTDIERYTDAAMRRLSEAQPGYPSGHDGSGSGYTQPERFKMLADDAVRDLEKLRAANRAARKAGLDMWGVVTKWGVARDARDLAVADPEDEMWCRSCLTIGHFSTRRAGGGVNCDWCATTLRELNRARGDAGKRAMTELPRQALQAHAEGRRISTRDLERWAGVKDIRRERTNRRKQPVDNTSLDGVVGQKVGFRQPDTTAPKAGLRVAEMQCIRCGETFRAEGPDDVQARGDVQIMHARHECPVEASA